MIKNYIVSNGNQDYSDKEDFFKNQEVEFIPANWTMYRLLVHAGFFLNIEEVEKNWIGPREIPLGLRNFFIGAKGKVKILNCLKLEE